MKTMQIFFTMLAVLIGGQPVRADALTNESTNPIVLIGDLFGEYPAIQVAIGKYQFINPDEFWHGAWKEDTNGWRVQLLFTNAYDGLLSVRWGSVVKNSGGGYLLPPNGKFAKFELVNPDGIAVQPKPNAGKNLFRGRFVDLYYGTNLPAWMDLSGGSLEAKFPEIISTNVYPRVPGGSIVLYTGCASNQPPSQISALKLYDLFSIAKEGDYTLTVQPVLYRPHLDLNYFPMSKEQLIELKKKQGPEHIIESISNGVYFVATNWHESALTIFYRVDLPSVTTKVHLVPNIK